LDARRAAVLRQYDDSLRRWQAVLMEIEKNGAVERPQTAAQACCWGERANIKGSNVRRPSKFH